MTFPGWVDRIGPFDVERQEGRRPGGQAYLKLELGTRRVIWHTTEGSSVDGAVATLRGNFSAPHFVVGPSRLVQMRPLWAEAATVRGDNSIAWQVEVVGFSQTKPWLPGPDTRKVIVELLGFFERRLSVPLKRPDGWLDDCSDITGTWATEGNSRRLSRRAPNFAGHVMHLEWPGNTHWDQGAITWARLFEEADMGLTDEQREKLNKVYNFLTGLDEVLDPDEAINAIGLGRRVGRAVKKAEADEPAPADGITVDAADARYVRKGERVAIAPAE